MSVPDTTTCPICYCIINMEFMFKHIEYHQEAGEIAPPESEYDPDMDDPFGDGDLTRMDF